MSEEFSYPFPYELSHVEGTWKKMRLELGMDSEKEFVIHSLRHTYITRLLKCKVGIEVEQRIAVHRDIRVTLCNG